MGKKRIHELAKELSMSSAELVQRIGELNLLQGQKLGASNSIEDSVAEEIRRAVRNAASPMPQVVRRRKPVDLPAPEQPASPFREIRPPHEGAADVQPPAAPQDASVPGGGDGPAAGQGAPPPLARRSPPPKPLRRRRPFPRNLTPPPRHPLPRTGSPCTSSRDLSTKPPS
ncbi:MAG: translation initiation factor IF-2 N-terminal domain-containing protein [Deltaproteobacteria bacterium]|jgi:hypothetical protein|nr:translation initiation factor IF-2 N-terminal domain-containing protein [Deltaproteobacteria bacterium]